MVRCLKANVKPVQVFPPVGGGRALSVAGTNAARQGCVLDLVAPAMDGFRAGTAGSPERGGGYHGVFPWSRATPTRRRSRSQTLGTAGHLAAPQRGSTGSPRLGASAIRERTCMHACAQPRRGRLTTINADKHASSKETKRAQHGWKTRRDGTPSDCTKKSCPGQSCPCPHTAAPATATIACRGTACGD